MPRILVVDDNDEFRNMICEILKGEGYEIDVAANGKDAIKLCCERPPDLVVTDLLMPDMDGVETIRELRNCNCNPKMEIIVISGGGTEVSGQDYLDSVKVMCNIKHIFSKPFEIDPFLKVVKDLTG